MISGKNIVFKIVNVIISNINIVRILKVLLNVNVQVIWFFVGVCVW